MLPRGLPADATAAIGAFFGCHVPHMVAPELEESELVKIACDSPTATEKSKCVEEDSESSDPFM